ncbi:MAG: hypothetical protein AB1391_03180 [Candidatus Micrarchaeota archaeon]
MSNLILHTASALAMFIVIAFSYYMIRNAKGKMSDGFKIILIGHVPLMFLHIYEIFSLVFEDIPHVDEIKLRFLDHTGQVIAAFSIFVAIYFIRVMVFIKDRGSKER